MGGKSSSSADSTQTTTTSTATSTGTVGDVVQGQTININQEVPSEVVDIFSQLVDLAKGAGQLAGDFSQQALESNKELAQAAKQPDLTLIQGYQKQVYYAIGAVGLVALLIFWKRK